MNDHARVEAVLDKLPGLAVAVSGGVDSLTLAHLASRRLGKVRAFHAMSPAVPAEATARVRAEAERAGWELVVLDAGEFADPRYRINPLDRCYFCKSNLYRRLSALTAGPVAAGTNLDDLADYRPGLLAAAERGVRHPFVEAGVGKAGVRSLARALGLNHLAELPAQPCLSSRVETGIPIEPADLAFVERVEAALRPLVGGELRCRITARGVRLEISSDPPPGLIEQLGELCASEGRRLAGFAPYRRGSAFLGASVR